MRLGIGIALGFLVLAGALARPAAATELVQKDCFGEDNERRITACSQLIDMPGIAADVVSSAFAMRALAFSLKGHYDTAIRDYDRAIEIRPDFAVALNNRAWAFFKSGQAARGLPDVEQSLRLDPRSPHAYDTRAHIRQQAGETALSFRDYEAAMRFGGTRMIQLYQCGLTAAGLYKGETDGLYSPDLRRALQLCVESTTCDPLPPGEDCALATS